MKNFKKVIFALMVVFLVVGFIGCKTESDPPKAEVEKWTVVYGEDSLKEGTYAELEEYAGKVGLDETTDYTVDEANKKIILTDSGMSKVTAYEGNNAGNDDNNDEENGSSTGGNTGNDNPGNTETPVVTNNFKGKTFIGMEGEGEDAYFAGYIIFTSDTDCEVKFFDEKPMPATYTVADDVATLKGTGDYAALQLSTTKLTDGKFSITIPTAVSGEEEDIVVSYAVGTLWTILYEDSEEDFSLKMPEEQLEYYVQQFGLVDGDYTKDDATKTVTLTDSGWAKVQAAMGGGSDDEGGNTETPETPEPPVVTNNFVGKTFLGMTGEGDDAYFASYIVFTSDTNCEVMFFDEEPILATYTVADDVATLTGTGEYAVLQISTTKLTDGTFEITIPPAVSGEAENIVVSYAVGTLWTILYEDSDDYFSLKMPEEGLADAVEFYGFIEADYTRDVATNTITLTASGWTKVQAAMGGGSGEEGGEDTGSVEG